MCADIHYGQEQHAPLKGPNTDARDQSSPDPSHPACNTRPVHADVPDPDSCGAAKCDRHSITSSARVSNCAGTSTPSAFAVWRFITSSRVVGNCTGRSPGLEPLNILSRYETDR